MAHLHATRGLEWEQSHFSQLFRSKCTAGNSVLHYLYHHRCKKPLILICAGPSFFKQILLPCDRAVA